MDIDRFRALHPPRMSPSRLRPHGPAILAMRADGYTYRQIGEWLHSIQIEVSIQAIQKFAKRLAPPPCPGPTAVRADPVNIQPPAGGLTSPRASRDEGDTRKARAEKTASKYLGGHPLDFSLAALLSSVETTK